MKKERLADGRVRRLHDPVEDRLTPIYPLDLRKIRTIDDLVRAMGQTAYTARQIGDAADVLEAMARDKDCTVVLTLSGALTVGKMGLVICDLIDSGVVHLVVSTGALMAHGLVEATGRSHFRYDHQLDDNELFWAGYNRVYDSLEPEVNLDEVEAMVDRVLEAWEPEEPVSSWKLNQRLGVLLHQTSKQRGILRSAYEKNVPVYVPAFTDSELGLDLALHNLARRKEQRPQLRFDVMADLEHFTTTLVKSKRMGIFTVGGGVPRNWAQQFGVFVELRIRRKLDPFELKRYQYGLRICPEPVNWGGLSGSTYSEAVSWGKFIPQEEGGRFAEVLEDATVALPLVVGAVLQRIGYLPRSDAGRAKKKSGRRSAMAASTK
ncbi:MAG: deoxyhypusine synthase family protein [Candidatus Acidiferrales bacterium]